jgi:Na+-translocating ferredoxin:NAD+ oxidoreductase subunit B
VIDFLLQYPLFSALLALVGLATVFGALLGFAAEQFKTEGNPIADEINNILPQTQCGQCGYPGCRPYAEAIANGEAINKCPPGGEAGIAALAALLDVEPIPLDAEHGEAKKVPSVAFIREAECIGCTKCIQACPVDTVISGLCTGCDLCVEPCPVDCIDMISQEESLQTWHWPLPDPVSRRIDIIATDSVHSDVHRDQAA